MVQEIKFSRNRSGRGPGGAATEAQYFETGEL